MDDNLVLRDCPACGIRYEADARRLKFGRQTTCSRACSYVLRANRLKNQERFACAVCGKEFVRTPAHVKSKHGSQFCSRACHYAGRSAGLSRRVVAKPYSITPENRAALSDRGRRLALWLKENNYVHSQATRSKMSIAAARAHAEGRIGRPSKLEDAVAVELDRLGVRYERQKAFRDGGGRFAMVLDFWLPDDGMGLEVNGTYWHADPRVYSGPLDATQIHNLAAYGRKMDSLKRLGVRVFEVWELDFKQDPTQAVLGAYTRATGR